MASKKNEEPPAYPGPPQQPQAAYGGYNQPPYGQPSYGDPNQQQFQHGPPPGGYYYQQAPPMGSYPPQGQPYGPPPPGGYYPPQGQYQNDRRAAPGFMEACLASLACCCCLECLLF